MEARKSNTSSTMVSDRIVAILDLSATLLTILSCPTSTFVSALNNYSLYKEFEMDRKAIVLERFASRYRLDQKRFADDEIETAFCLGRSNTAIAIAVSGDSERLA
jgi:hypothetical protein